MNSPARRSTILGLAFTITLGIIAVAYFSADAHPRRVIIDTLTFAAAVIALSLPIGIALALLIRRTDALARKLASAAMFGLLFTPLVLVAAAWQAGWGTFGAWLPAHAAMPWLAGWWGAVIVQAAAAIPWVVLWLSLALRQIPPAEEEAALLEGSPWQVIRRVTLPNLLPAIAAAALWVLLWSTGEMVVTDLFAIETFAREVYNLSSLGATPAESLAEMTPMLTIIAALAAFTGIAAQQLMRGIAPPPSVREVTFHLGRGRIVATIALLLATIILLGIPLASLIAKAGVVVDQTPDGFVRSWSVPRVIERIMNNAIGKRAELGWTFLIGGTAALTAVAIAAPLAWWGRRGNRIGIVVGTAALIAAIPGPLIGLALIATLNQRELPWLTALYDRSILAPVLAQAIRIFPPTLLTLWYGLRDVPQEVLDAAAIDGAGPLRRFALVICTERRAAVALGMLVALAVAIGELSATILVLPPGVTTATHRIFGLLHATAGDEVAGLGLVLAGLCSLLALTITRLARR